MDARVLDFARRASRAGLFCDFDGTLSEIVDVPSEARAVGGAREVMARLGRRFAVVAIVSGRAADEIIDRVGTDVEIWGLHGAEHVVGGEVVVAERAAPYIDVMNAIGRKAAQLIADASLAGVVVEEKGPMLGFHYRMADDEEKARPFLEELAERFAAEHRLVRAHGRKVIELRPPLDFSKQQVVLDLARARSLEAAAFLGDDLVDVPAFKAIDELGSEGLDGLKVAVSSEEAPPELLSLADIVLKDPTDVVRFLNQLADAASDQ